jgi:hypothetical protein
MADRCRDVAFSKDYERLNIARVVLMVSCLPDITLVATSEVAEVG